MAKQPETGYTICRKANKLIKGCESVGDNSRHISMKICCPNGGVPVGTMHTHPGASTIQPSPQDISEMQRLGLQLLCISIPEKKFAKCYKV